MNHELYASLYIPELNQHIVKFLDYILLFIYLFIFLNVALFD